MAESRSSSFSERQLALYLEEYYELADLIFRFGALLTLSREGGERIVDETFALLVADFVNIKTSANPTFILMSLAWKAWRKVSNEKFHEWDLPILKSMKSLYVNQRAILFALEVAGLDLREAASVFGGDEHANRSDLAEANRFLALNEIRI